MTRIVLPSKAIFYGDKSGANKFNFSTKTLKQQMNIEEINFNKKKKKNGRERMRKKGDTNRFNKKI